MVTFARRAQNQAAAELTTILAGSPEGVLSLAGGFPNPATFPSGLLDEIVAKLVRDDAGVALQYAPCEGIPSLREYLVDRQETAQGAPARLRRADRHQRRDGVHRARLPEPDRPRRHASPSRRRPTSAR